MIECYVEHNSREVKGFILLETAGKYLVALDSEDLYLINTVCPAEIIWYPCNEVKILKNILTMERLKLC